MKGIVKFKEKLPDLKDKRIFFLPFIAFLSLVFGLAFLLILDTFPRMNPNITILTDFEFLLPVFGSLITSLLGWLLVFNIWYKKDKYLAIYKQKAYQRGIIYAMLGIPLVIATVIHIYFPIERFFNKVPVNNITQSLSSPIIEFDGVWRIIELMISTFGSLFFLFLGMITGLRALFTFGIDYMGLVYLYYPMESEVQNHGVYSVVRHPAYLGIITFAFGGVLAQMSIYSFLTFLIVVIGFSCHIRLVEEQELIQRFGTSFLAYRKKVPALFIKPRDMVTFFKFLVGKLEAS